MPVDMVTSIIQLATNGGFAALVWYLVIKHCPAIEARHQTERQEWLTYIKARDLAFDQMTERYWETIAEFKQEVKNLKDLFRHDRQ